MNRGFTLIELMVSVTIFIIVMVIALGSLLSISEAERKAETLKTVMNNLNFGLESMARTIRTGVTYHCGGTAPLDQPNDCLSGQSTFAFIPACVSGGACPPPPTVYTLSSGDPDCGTGSIGGCIMVSKDGGNNYFALTAPEINITNLTFYVVGSHPEFDVGNADQTQPKVTITMHGNVPSGPSQTTEFSLQTSVTQRIYDQ